MGEIPSILGLRKWNGTGWTLLFEDEARAVPDVRFVMDEGVLTFVLAQTNFHAVIVERYEADSGWRRTESMVFPGHALPYGRGASGFPNLAVDGGEPAILMSSPESGPVVYRRRAGIWDTLPVGRPLIWPALAREGDDLFLAFADSPGSGDSQEDYPIAAWRSEGRGWRSLGADIFSGLGRECRIEVHQGRPTVLALVGRRPLVARLTEEGWKTLVAPRFTDFLHLYDFALDGAGVPHLAVFGSEFRVVKFIDPYLP